MATAQRATLLPATFSVGPAARASAPWASAGCSSTPAGLTLYVGTHTALLSHDVASGCWRRLSEGRGHYYGVVPVGAAVPGSPSALLVGSQGRLSRPKTTSQRSAFLSSAPPRNASSGLPGVSDALLLLDPASRAVVGWWGLPSVYLHDTIFEPESGSLYAVDSESGDVLQLSLDAIRESRRICL